MEKLFQRFNTRITHVSASFKRYLYDRIDWTNRLVCIKGSRGVGKTTLLLQRIVEAHELNETTLYVSLDDIYFQANTLVDLTETFYANGGKYLFLDEVHKYPNWSQEIKNIYDNYQDLYIVFTSSSLLEIHKGEADLSRRAVNYHLHGLSFREFLWFENKLEIQPLSLDNVLQNHVNLAREITADVKILPLFKKYLKLGYYPFYKESEEAVYHKITAVINLILESDVAAVYKTEYATIHKLKKLLYVIATSVPFQPNVSKLSQKIETTSRSSTLKYLHYLELAGLISNLKTGAKGNNTMAKPDKIYLENTSLIYTLGEEKAQDGNLRETFFFSQLKADHVLSTSLKADFLVDGTYTFEVGGKNKKTDQIKGIKNSFIAADNIELGFNNKIPLWLFGCLY